MSIKNIYDRSMNIPLVVLGIPFHDVTFSEAVAWSLDRIRSKNPGYIATANLDFVMQSRQDPELQRILLNADLVVADGTPLIWLSGLFGPRLRERVTGSDLTLLLAEACRDNDLSIFALGAAPGVARKAMQKLQDLYPGLRVAGVYSPPKAEILQMNHQDILGQIRKASPDLLLVAFGAPKQEKWINMHYRKWKVPLSMGVGGTLDFLAGVQRRAPKAFQRVGMEWFWRMLTDPRRLAGRYASNLKFLAKETALFYIQSRPEKSDNDNTPLPGPIILDEAKARIISFRALSSYSDIQLFLDENIALSKSHSLILDMKDSKELSSLELGTLVMLEKTCRSHNHRLFLWGLRPKLKKFLTSSRIKEYLGVVCSQQDLNIKLERLNPLSRDGDVLSIETGVLKARLPTELTVRNVDDYQEKLNKKWAEVISSGGLREVYLDAGELEFVDSAALDFLVELRKRADQENVILNCPGFYGAARQTFSLAHIEY